LQLFIFSINDLILVLLICAALFFDLTRKRIPNFLTFPAIIYGIISYTTIQGLEGLWFSFLGLLVGLAIFFIPFAMGGMGGGDVKLLGAVGALQGWQFVFSAAILAALAGGVMALVYLAVSGRLLRVLKKMAGFILAPFFSALFSRTGWEFFNRASIFFAKDDPEEKEQTRMPYAVAIAAGVLILLMIDLFQGSRSIFDIILWQ
jgi:prepilin peptidase CpaA